jgi:hypothetical protein
VVDHPGQRRRAVEEIARVGEQQRQPGFDRARWHLIFTLLSMDSVAPFLSDMGLDVQNPEAIRAIAREAVRAYRAAENDPSRSDARRGADLDQVIETALVNIAAEIHPDERLALVQWDEHVFQYDLSQDADMFRWKFLMRRLAGLTGATEPLARIELAEERLEGVRQIITTHLGHSLTVLRRINEARRSQITSWDSAIAHAYGSDSSPLDWVENTVEHLNTRRSWDAIRALLTPDELTALEAWGVQQATLMGMR